MKKLRAIVMALAIVSSMLAWASAPKGFSYQATVRNADGSLAVNKIVGVRVSILRGSVTGAVVYSETNTVKTNANGLFSLQVGAGTVKGGSFADIDWADGTYYMRSEISLNNNSVYDISATSQLLSVPFAMYADKAGEAKTAETLSGTVDYSSIANAPTYSKVAESGAYDDLTGRPTSVSAFANDANYLTNAANSLTRSGNNIVLNDMNGDPLSEVSIETDATVDYSAIANKPSFSAVATSGAYSDLDGAPTKVSDLDNDAKYISEESQELQRQGNTVYLVGGKTETSIDLTQTEAQTIGLDASKKLYITDGNGNKIAEVDLSNLFTEKQELSLTGSELSLTGGAEASKVDLAPLMSSGKGGGASLPSGTNKGDLLYWNSEEWAVLPRGVEGQMLAIADGQLTWIDPSYANTVAGTYAVGDIYYEDGMPVGVVVQSSSIGRMGKIIALTDAGKTAWSSSDKVSTGAKDLDFGQNNLNTVKLYDPTDWATKYEAFGLADGKDGWYVPSRNELSVVYDNKISINNALANVPGAKALNAAYWTSTEYGNVTSYVAFINDTTFRYDGEPGVLVPAGTIEEDAKDSKYNVRLMRKLSWAEMTSKPIVKTYNLGDTIKDEKGNIGLVYKVSNGGLNGYAISIKEGEVKWGTAVAIGSTSATDGEQNLATAKAVDGWNTKCLVANYNEDNYGDGWYVPAIEELMDIQASLDVINGYMDKVVGSAQLAKVKYWSSTESDADKAKALNFSDGMSSDEGKTTSMKIRTIYKF
jgi:hypothetical protein